MKSDEKLYAIAIQLNCCMEKENRQAWHMLDDKFGLKYISSRSDTPHLTILHDFKAEKQLMCTELEELSKKLTTFKITGNGLGIFVSSTPVIYIRWDINQQLLDLADSLRNHLSFVDKKINLNWIPRSTLAFKDTNYDNLSQILMELQKLDFKREMVVDTLCLIEYSLEMGEKIIAHFKLESKN